MSNNIKAELPLLKSKLWFYYAADQQSCSELPEKCSQGLSVCDCMCICGEIMGRFSILRSWRTLLVPAATSAGAQRENTQSRLSAQPGPAAHSLPLLQLTLHI